MADDLKGCPFCGSENISYFSRPYNDPPLFYIRCNDCLAHGPIKNDDGPDIIAWNTRLAEDNLRSQMDALEVENAALKNRIMTMGKALIDAIQVLRGNDLRVSANRISVALGEPPELTSKARAALSGAPGQ